MTDASAAGSVEPRVADATTELAHRYAEALIGAAEKEGGVEPLWKSWPRSKRMSEGVSQVRGIARFAPGFVRS